MKRHVSKELASAIEAARPVFERIHTENFGGFMTNVGYACLLWEGSKSGPAQTCLNMAAMFLLAHERLTGSK